MKASEVVKKLNSIIEKDGDLEVVYDKDRWIKPMFVESTKIYYNIDKKIIVIS